MEGKAMDGSFISECSYSDISKSLETHFHDDFELLYVKRGKSLIHLNGESYEMSRGSIAFIGRLDEHSVTVLSADYQRYFMVLDAGQLEPLLAEPKLTSVFRNRSASFIPVVNLALYAGELDWLFGKILEEFNRGEEYSSHLISVCIEHILIYVYRSIPDVFNFVHKEIYKDVYKIQKYIESNYMHDVKITDIAAEYFISIHYLSRCFRAVTGRSPKQYLINTRIAHAKYLLVHTAMPVKDISFKCGFNDVNNFIRSFKEATALTPYKYRSASKTQDKYD
jgi:AraC-like DNA-binding protein